MTVVFRSLFAGKLLVPNAAGLPKQRWPGSGGIASAGVHDEIIAIASAPSVAPMSVLMRDDT